jgi:hypothetical protein
MEFVTITGKLYGKLQLSIFATPTIDWLPRRRSNRQATPASTSNPKVNPRLPHYYVTMVIDDFHTQLV